MCSPRLSRARRPNMTPNRSCGSATWRIRLPRRARAYACSSSNARTTSVSVPANAQLRRKLEEALRSSERLKQANAGLHAQVALLERERDARVWRRVLSISR
jgi:hypothetical protein